MENERNRIYTVVALVALAALLLSCSIGALAGGIAGALMGRRQAQAVTDRVHAEELGRLPGFGRKAPCPWRENHPFAAPGHPEDLPPSERMPVGVTGAIILEVVPGSPADMAGLEVGDLITAIDRTPIDPHHPLQDAIIQYEPGDRITIHLLRGEQEESVRAKLAEHPDNLGQAYLGIFFEMIGEPVFESP
jgi:hypothetical protein